MLYIYLLAISLAIIAGSRVIEQRWPIATTPRSEVQDDWLAAIVSVVLPIICQPITKISSTIILNHTGLGWIHLPTVGRWYFISLAFLVLTADLFSYGYHRLVHAVPCLWALHSFHHSANALTFVTGARHLWIERVIDHACLPVMTILFLVPPDMIFLVGVISFLPDTCAHLNVRFRMGRFITCVNSPQWHRIHHSVHPEHRDRNFASVLPLWDILFGTAYIPHRDEYPATGLVPAERVDVIDSIIWPFRHLRHRRGAPQ